MKPILYWMAALLLLVGCGGNLGMVGYNTFGVPSRIFVKQQRYQEELTRAITAVDASVRPVLLKQSEKEKEWKLRTIMLGFGVKAQGGIGSLTGSISPRIRVAFSNGQKPPVP